MEASWARSREVGRHWLTDHDFPVLGVVMTTSTRPTDRYTVISADCHAGADLLDYRPYLEKSYHDDFDAWAATYVNPYEDLLADTADRNWNSDRRLAELEADGIVAEVVFPNTIPPFFPSASLMAPAPTRGGVRAALGRPARPQPLARRLLRGRPGPPGGRRADPAQRRRRGGPRDPPDRRRRASPAASCCPVRRRARACPSCTRRRTTRSGRSATSSAYRSTTTAARRPRRSATNRRPARCSWWRPPGSRTGPCGT